MGIRAKLLLPVLMAFIVLAGIIYWYWLPQYMQHEKDTWNKHQNQLINAIKPFLVRDILAGDLASLYTTLGREVASHRQDWRALLLLNDKGKRIYLLSAPSAINDINLVKISHTLEWQGRTIIKSLNTCAAILLDGA